MQYICKGSLHSQAPLSGTLAPGWNRSHHCAGSHGHLPSPCVGHRTGRTGFASVIFRVSYDVIWFFYGFGELIRHTSNLKLFAIIETYWNIYCNLIYILGICGPVDLARHVFMFLFYTLQVRLQGYPRHSWSFQVTPHYMISPELALRGSTLVPFNPFWRTLRLCSRCCGDGEPSWSQQISQSLLGSRLSRATNSLNRPAKDSKGCWCGWKRHDRPFALGSRTWSHAYPDSQKLRCVSSEQPRIHVFLEGVPMGPEPLPQATALSGQDPFTMPMSIVIKDLHRTRYNYQHDTAWISRRSDPDLDQGRVEVGSWLCKFKRKHFGLVITFIYLYNVWSWLVWGVPP